jgi:hypothetical protein
MIEKKQQDGLYKYGEMVRLAKLDLKAKALLWFYAYTYNWSENRPSYYTQEQICAYVGFSPSTYQKSKKRLVELGWIKTTKPAFDKPVFVTPKKGRDDEKYEKYSWAKGHKTNKTTLEEDIENLPPEFRNPFM